MWWKTCLTSRQGERIVRVRNAEARSRGSPSILSGVADMQRVGMYPSPGRFMRLLSGHPHGRLAARRHSTFQRIEQVIESWPTSNRGGST
jgi:hypothetical protein